MSEATITTKYELELSVTANQAREIHRTSNFMINKMLEEIAIRIREVAVHSRQVQIGFVNGASTHVSYAVPNYGTLVLTQVSTKLLEVLVANGFVAKFEAGEAYKARGSGDMLTPYTLTVRW